MRKNYLLLGIVFISLIIILSNGIYATTESHKQDEELDLKRTCTFDGSPCSASGECNISIKFPNQTYLFNNISMTNQLNGDFNVTLSSTNTSTLGDYCWDMYCSDNGQNNSAHSCFIITPTGRQFDSAQGIVSIGILFAALVLAFIFLKIGFSLEENIKTLPIGFLFVILGLFLGIYSLHLSYVFSNDILAYESLTPVTIAMYTTVLYSLSGIAIISAALMLISFIKELSKMNKSKKFGEGFDPITNTYQ